MKKIALLIFLVSSMASAASLNLSVGETATVYANTNTTVSCGGSGTGTNCSIAADSFRKSMEYCYKSESGYNCAREFWPNFKDSYPECSAYGTDTCLEYCYKSASGSTCASLCQ